MEVLPEEGKEYLFSDSFSSNGNMAYVLAVYALSKNEKKMVAIAPTFNFCCSRSPHPIGTKQPLFTFRLHLILMKILLLILALQTSAFAGRMKMDVLKWQVPVKPSTTMSDQRGYERLFPNQKLAVYSQSDSSGTIFTIQVNRDSHGFRVASPEQGPYRSHIFLVGCSFTFGEGIAESETFAMRLAKTFSKTRVVNMGLIGGTASDHLYLWQGYNWPEFFTEKNGIMIYTLFSDHFEREGESWRYLSWASPIAARFNEKQEFQGVLGEQWNYRFAHWMKKSGLENWWLRLSYHWLNWTLRNGEDRLVARIVALKKAYLARYPKGKFVVSRMPHQYIAPLGFSENEFIKKLEENGLEYWETVPPQGQEQDQKYAIPRDGHPNALANHLYSDLIQQKLASLKLISDL